MASKCRLPTFVFVFPAPPWLPSFRLPTLPVISFSISLYCPLD